MHYIVNVFVKPGDSLEDAMAPFREDIGVDDDAGAWHGQRQWDWWVEGGRWEGYFNESTNVTTAGELVSGEVKGKFDTPFSFVTLSKVDGYPNVSRLWHSKETHVPVGFYEESKRRDGSPSWGLSYFIDAPNYKKHFEDYLREVPADTLVYAVDVHS
jgi:hypothetical protein